MADKLKFLNAEHIAELCLKKFAALPKTGKPTDKEWTVLAGIVLHNDNNHSSKVVALGTGTKCIGKSKLCSKGLILNDSHAEVLARRALLQYFYHELEKASIDDENAIFTCNSETSKYEFKPQFNLHFFSTQTPCGDACIDAELDEEESGETPTKKMKFESTQEGENMGALLQCMDEIVYTGAKLIGGDCHVDAMQQTIGAVRTKPGRGERTLSMSCSDKLSKWNVLGIQGALLDILLVQPIYFATMTFCQPCKLSCLERAVFGRWQDRPFINIKYAPRKPEIRIWHANIDFQQDPQKQPSPNGLVWCDLPTSLKPYEISVNGKRQGITSKQLQTPRAALQISKYALLKAFVNLLRAKPKILECLHLTDSQLEHTTYAQFKQLAEEYQKAWLTVKSDYFRQWTCKPKELLEFTIEKVEKS